MGSPQKPSNPLKDPELPARFARLIIKHMIRLRWSDDQLLRKIRDLGSGTRGSLASIARYKAGTGGQPSTQQIGLYAEALGWDESERHGLLYPGESLAAGQPTQAELQTQWKELLAELQRQTNLPYEVEMRRAAAKTALKAEDYDRARDLLTEVANATQRTAEHAAEEYARALASLGALAFTEADFAEARAQYGLAMTLPGLSAERLARYQHSYRVASNAVAARTRDEQQARAIIKEMKDKGITPDQVTMVTAIKRMSSFEAALGLIDDCLAKRWFVGRGSFEAAYSWPIGHLAADELLAAYHARPFKFDTALAGPINQYRKARRLGDALKLVISAPHVGAAQKLYREAYEDCRAFFEAELERGNDEDNLYYAFGIAAALNGDRDTAVPMLEIARERAHAEKRIAHIDRLLAGVLRAGRSRSSH